MSQGNVVGELLRFIVGAFAFLLIAGLLTATFTAAWPLLIIAPIVYIFVRSKRPIAEHL